MTNTDSASNISFGPRLGGNLANAASNTLEQATSSGSDYTYSRSPILAYQVGLAASFGWGHWAFQPSLMLTEKGLKQRALDTESFQGTQYTDDLQATSRVHYLEPPLNVVYSFTANGEGFQVFAGPYVAVGVGGHASYSEAVSSNDPTFIPQAESISQAFAFGNTFPEPDPNSTSSTDIAPRTRRFDAGINVGVGYRRGPYQAQLGYGLGLLNVQPDYPASYQIDNDTGYLRTAQLTLSYYFPLNKK